MILGWFVTWMMRCGLSFRRNEREGRQEMEKGKKKWIVRKTMFHVSWPFHDQSSTNFEKCNESRKGRSRIKSVSIHFSIFSFSLFNSFSISYFILIILHPLFILTSSPSLISPSRFLSLSNSYLFYSCFPMLHYFVHLSLPLFQPFLHPIHLSILSLSFPLIHFLVRSFIITFVVGVDF